MANLQKFLLAQGTIKDLKEKYSLKVSNHPEYPNLHLFKYDMINSPFSKIIVREARGIILDANDSWNIVSYPYDKFFNHKESNRASLDLDSAVVCEKLDGSLITLYYYDNNWHISTSGRCDAAGFVDRKITFKELFWNIWKELGYKLPTDTSMCFMFELLSPTNQIIVPQRARRIVLHGARCLKTLKEKPFKEYATKYGWDAAKVYQFHNVEKLIKQTNALGHLDGEGYVLCDKNFNRVKFKSAIYVKLHHFGSVMSLRGMIGILQTNEKCELLAYFPKLQGDYLKVQKCYQNIVDEIGDALELVSRHKSRKKLAEKIGKLWYSSCIFSIKDNKYKNVQEWLCMKPPKYLEKHFISLLKKNNFELIYLKY